MKQGTSPGPEEDSRSTSSIFALSRSPEHRIYLKTSSSDPIPMEPRYTSRLTVWWHETEFHGPEFSCDLLIDSGGLIKWKEVCTDSSGSLFAFRCPITAGRSHPIEDFTDYCVFLIVTGEFDSQFDALARQFLENCSEKEMIKREGTFPVHFSALDELSEQLVLSMSPKALTVLLALYKLTGTPCASRNAQVAAEALESPSSLDGKYPLLSSFSERALKQCAQGLPSARGSERDAGKALTSPVHLLRGSADLLALIGTAGRLVGTSSREWQSEFNLLAATMLQKTKFAEDEITAEIFKLSEAAQAFIGTTVLSQYCSKPQPLQSSSRTAVVYFATCPQELGSTTSIHTSCGRVTLGAVQWSNPLSHPYQLWSGECPAEDNDTEFSIVVKKERGLTYNEVSRVPRVILAQKAVYFIFASKFQSPLMTSTNTYRCADMRKSFELYLTYLLTKTEYLDDVESLMAQYGEVDYLSALGLARQLQELGSVQPTEQLGLLAVRLLGSCQDPAQAARQYWEGLLELSVGLLRTGPLQRASEPIYRGYAEIMKMRVEARQSEWLLILQRVPLTAEYQHFFVPFFEHISESDATYIVGEILSQEQMIDGRYLHFLFSHLNNVHTFLSAIALFLQGERVNSREKECIELVNLYFTTKTLKIAEVEAVYQQFASFPEQTRTVLKKSSLTKSVENALKQNIEKKWTSLYQLMLLGEGKQLVPALNLAQFALDLIAIHRFDFLSTYNDFKPLFPDVLQVFRAWVALQRQQSFKELLSNCDAQLYQCRNEVFEQKIADIAANEIYTACESLMQYLISCSNYRFTSNTLEQSCRKRGEAAISEKMKPTIISNELLSRVMALRKEKESCVSLFETALRCLQPSPRAEILTALLRNVDANAYWVGLFQSTEASCNPAVRACIDYCIEFSEMLAAGNLTFTDFSCLLNDAQVKRIFEVVAAAAKGRTDAAQLAERRNHWQSSMETSRAAIQKFHTVLERLFPKIPLPHDVQRFFPMQYTQYCKEQVASIASLPASLQCWHSQSALYDQLLRSEIYRTLVVQRSGDPANLLADRFAESLEEARSELERKIQEIAKPPSEVLMVQVMSIFGNLRDPDGEIETLKAVIPKLSLNLVCNSLKLFRSIREMKMLCEAVMKCEYVLQLSDQRALEACKSFRAAILEVQGDFTLEHITNIASTLPSVCTIDVVSHQDAVGVLTAIGKHEIVVRRVLEQDEDKLSAAMEMAGTQDDVAIDPNLIDNFMKLRNFINEIIGMDNINKLLTKIKAGIARNEKIIDLLKYCAEKLPILEGIGEVINITEKTKVEWILAMLNNSVATFKENANAMQLSISFQIPGRPSYTKDADELEALSFQCALILESSGSEEYRSKLQAFIALLSLLFQVQRKVSELDSLGADVSEIKQGKECRISSDRSEEAEALDQQLSQELELWRNGCAVESYPLTYMFGDHIWAMEKAFLSGYAMSELQQQQVSAWAKAMGKIFTTSQKNQPLRNTVQRLTQLDASLNQLSEIASESRNFSYIRDAQSAPAATQQILYFETSDACSALVSAYVQLRRKLPESDQVMVCLESTSLGEFLSFLRHCFTCKRPKLFALLHSHRLPSTLQTEGTRLIEELLPLRSPASFLVVSENSKGHFAQFIRSKIRLWTVRELDSSFLVADYRCIQEIAPATKVLLSNIPGLGKTYYAVAQAKTEGRRLFIFPVTGELETEALSLSLCEKRVCERSSLLIQIGYVEPNSYHILENFLLQMVLLLSFKTRKHFFMLPTDCQVSFEVQSTPTKQWVMVQSPLKHLSARHFAKIDKFTQNEDEERVLAYLDVYNRSPANLAREVTGTVGNRCQQVIESGFAAKCRARGDSVSYRSIKSFLGFLSYQLKGLSMSVFSPEDPDFARLRPTVFECFMRSTLEYTVKSMKVVSNEQLLTAEHKQANHSAHMQCTVGWENSNHDNVFCISSGQLVFIYKNLNRANPVLRDLFSQQQAMLKRNSSLPNYEQMSSDELINTLRDIHCPNRRLETTSYVMTPDNFLKINLIFTRMLAGIPIVCMGESGCGKTYLLNFLVNTFLGETLVEVNIHAGVTAADIEERITQVTQRVDRKRVWVFFDEFNTSACMGVVSEILCDRRLNGVDLPNDIVFVAACNPYRLKPQAMLNEKRAGIKHKNEDPEQRLLLHVVKPLPESLLEYLWDFGDLAKLDLKKYINAILSKDIAKDVVKYYSEAIFYAHEFLAENQYASVSLRDVKRFVIIYKWLQQIMPTKSRVPPKYLESRGLSIPRDIVALPPDKKAGAVAFYLTYIMRISVKDKRDELAKRAASTLRVSSLQAIMQAEQDELIARMELPKDIVANEALRENLYTLFVCIYTRIPAILCGKPGCSKSLAYQCLFENCVHRCSSDEWLKTLPGLNLVYFQGSIACTSDAILKSFSRAKKIVEAVADKLAVVVFDEIGLAELSPYNPLKVLHKELELDNAEERQGVAFVGISNWALDASKMNRMLHISRPDPTLEEVQYTARNIFNALASPQAAQYSAIAEAAAKAYFYVKSEIETQHQERGDFYGLRDFYHLIKLIVRSLNELKSCSNENVAKAVNFAVQRNFGGWRDVATRVWKYIVQDCRLIQQFSEMPSCGVLELMVGNLADKRSRYLMIITDGELAEYVLQHKIRVDLREKLILVGSTLPGDNNSDTYARRRLSDMITYMERGASVILKGMDQIYSSLYDLFNQNFKETSMGKFCRVAIGNSFKPRCFVHNDFHVILIAHGDEDSINALDAPFLNRFEKHIFDLRLLLTQEKKALAKRVDDWVKSTLSPGGHSILLSPTLIFPTYSLAATQLNILRAAENLPEEKLFEMLKRQLIAAAPSDLLVLAELTEGPESQFLKQTWRDTHTASYAQVTERLLGSQLSLFLVFTYEFKGIENVAVKTQYLAACSTEDDLVSGVKSYLKDQTATLYCLVLNYTTERKHFSFVMHTLQRLSQEEVSAGRQAKKLVLVVLQQRNVAHEATGSDYSSWSVLSADCFGRDSVRIDDSMLRMNCVDLVTRTTLFDFCESLKPLLFPLVFQLKYEPSALILDKSTINKHVFLIIENFEKHAGLVEAFKSKAYQYLRTGIILEKNWKECVFRDPQCVDRSPSAHSAILYVLTQVVRKAMAICLFAVESKLAMRSFFVLWTEPEGEVLREMWITYFNSIEPKVGESLQSSLQSHKVPFAVLLNFPFSLDDYELIMEPGFRRSFENFAEAFTSRSVTKGFLKHINASPRLQYLYFCDIVSIAVWKEHYSPDIEELMVRLVWSLVTEENEFVLKVRQLVSNWPLISWYCGYVLLYAEFAGEKVRNLQSTFLWEKALRRLPEGAATPPKDLPPVQYTPNKFAGSQQRNFPPAGANAGVAQWKEEVRKAVNKSILLLYPRKNTASKRPMEEWSQWLSRFEKVLKGFEGNLPNFSAFETLIRFPQHSKSAEAFQFFVRVCEAAASGPTESVFASRDVQKEIFDRLAQLQTAAPEVISSFRSLLLAEMVRNSAQSVSTVATQVNKEDGFWKHSGAAMEALVQCSRLREVCKHLAESCGSELEPLIERNEWVLAIENLLKESPGLNSHFAVLLSDRCLTALSHSRIFTEDFLVNSFDSFRVCESVTQKQPKELPNTSLLIALTFIKRYLGVYCWKLATQSFERSGGAWDTLSEILSRNPLLRKCCLTHLNFILNQQGKSISVFLASQRNLPWLLPVLRELENTGSPMLFFRTSPGKVFWQVLHGLKESKREEASAEQTLRYALNLVRTQEEKLQFAVAFISEVSLYRDRNDSFRGVSQVLKSIKQEVASKLGAKMATLLEAIVENFSPGDFAHIPSRCPEGEKQHKVAVHCLLAVITAFAGVKGSLTSVFFTPDGVASGSNFSSMYVPGAPHEPLYEHLYAVQTNPGQFGAASWSECGNCDNIVATGDCERAAYNCPFCNSQIGGTENVDRHRELETSAVAEAAAARIQNYLASKQKPGMSSSSSSLDTAGMRGISSLSLAVLRYIVKCYLNFLCSWCNDSGFKRAFPHEGSSQVYFNTTLNESLSNIRKQLDCDEDYLWVFRLVSELPGFLQSHAVSPRTPAERTEFERAFDTTLVQPYTSNLVEVVGRYKVTVPKATFAFYEEVGSHVVEDPRIRFFRVTRKPNIELLFSIWKRNPNPTVYPALGVTISSFTTFSTLQGILPILNLTKYLTEKYSHKLSREDARRKPIREYIDQDPKIRLLFKEFLEVWGSVSSDPAFALHQLPPVTFTAETKIIYFLPDAKENGGRYTCAALNSLADRQNKLLGAVASAIAQGPIDSAKLHIQEVAPEHIFRCALADPAFLQSSFCNNPAYANGRDVVFDYDRIEQQILADFKRARPLSVEGLHLFQFQGEFLAITAEYSTIIEDIRKSIHQEPLSTQDLDKLKQFIYHFERNNPQQFKLFLQEVHDSLEYVLCIVRNERVPSSTTLAEVAGKYDVHQVCETLLKHREISGTAVQHIVHLYEEFELLCFQFVKVDEKFTEKDNSNVVERCVTRVRELGNSVPPPAQVRSAVMRLIVRLLDESMEKSDLLGQFIVKPDLWPEDVDDGKLEMVGKALSEVHMKYVCQVYSLLGR